MIKRNLSNDVIEATDATPIETVALLDRFDIDEYWEKSFHKPHDLQDTTEMINYVEKLKQEGLDIGKGDYQFGYKMPIPKKGTSIRCLQIFRRK